MYAYNHKHEERTYQKRVNHLIEREKEIKSKIALYSEKYGFIPNNKQINHMLDYLMNNEELDINSELKQIFKLFSNTI